MTARLAALVRGALLATLCLAASTHVEAQEMRWAACPVPARPQAAPLQRVVPFEGPTQHDAALELSLSLHGGAEGNLLLTGVTPQLTFRKTVGRDGRFTLDLEGGSEHVTIEASWDRVRVSRGSEVVVIDPQVAAEESLMSARQLLASSRAVVLFRLIAANVSAPIQVSAAGRGLMMSAAFVAMLDGDPDAVGRLAWQLAGEFKTSNPSSPPPDQTSVVTMSDGGSCYSAWEEEVVAAMDEYIACLDDFSSYNPMRILCGAQWTLRVEVAWFQMISCAAIPINT
jgi:hypothetical protein